MGSQNWYGIGIRLQSVNTAVLFWNWSKLEFRFPSTMEIWIDTRGTIVHIIFSRSNDHGSRELGWRRAAMLHLEERSLMEAMSKQVVPVLYEELYQLNFLPVLYGPSTGRIVPPTGQSCGAMRQISTRTAFSEFSLPNLCPLSCLSLWRCRVLAEADSLAIILKTLSLFIERPDQYTKFIFYIFYFKK